MKKRLKLFAVLFGIAVLIFTFTIATGAEVTARGCPNNDCEGYNPQTMGCSAYTGGRLNVPDGGVVETRKSQGCNAKWTRTTNVSGANRYVAGTVWYGGANYDYHYSVNSPALISSGEGVYTAMTTPLGKSVVSCGLANQYNSISVPVSKNITVWCPYAN